MGMKGKESTSNALAVQLDAHGKVKYDLIARQGHSKDKVGNIKKDVLIKRVIGYNYFFIPNLYTFFLLQIVYSKLSDLLPSEVMNEDDISMQLPNEDISEELSQKTAKALQNIIGSKVAAAMPVRCAEKQAPAQYIRYTPSQQGQSFNSGAKQRVIRMVEAQVDPLEPPKFKLVFSY